MLKIKLIWNRVICFAVFILQANMLVAQPYPDSQFIIDVVYDWSTHDRRAPGSDNWPITWTTDDEQLSSFGDGGGFGGTNSNGRVSLGFSSITGSKDNHIGTNIWGGENSLNPAQFGGKSYGVLDVAGTLYAWWGPGSGTTTFTQTRLLRSTDSSATWEQSSWDLTDTDSDLVSPTILNFGRGYQGSRDNFIYHYFKHRTDLGRIDLARVPIVSVFDLSQYEWFTGIQQGQPTWSSNALDRVAVFDDDNGVGWSVSVSYNAGLQRYFLMTENTNSMDGIMGMFEATEPWGPWATVVYHTGSDQFGIGEIQSSTFFWNFSNKWMSANGENFVMVFTGVQENDSWNTIHGSFVLENDVIFINSFE